MSIVIADSSNSSCESDIQRLNSVERHAGMIHYFYQDNFNYYSKILSALQQVKTPYCIMCPDDDFIIWQNIKHLVAKQ